MPSRSAVVASSFLLLAGCSAGGAKQLLAPRSPIIAPSPAPAPLPGAQPPLSLGPPPSAPATPVMPVAAQTPPAAEADPCQRLADEATERHGRLRSYIARLRRREMVKDKAKGEELLIFKWMAQPWSLHLKWLSDEGKGREVIFAQGDPKLHILTAKGDIPFMSGGQRMDLAHDSPLVKAASRHSITEAGLGTTIDKYRTALAAARRGDTPGATYQYLGMVRRPEYPYPLESVENLVPPGLLPECPQGGKRTLFFDPNSKLPVVFELFDHAGKELEYHCFDRFQFDAALDGRDFDPEALWASPGKTAEAKR